MSNRKRDKNQRISKNAYVKDYDEDNHNNSKNNNQKKSDDIRSLSTLDYIKETVQKEVQEGLLEVARKKPKKPIYFLGKFLVEKSRKKNK